MNKKTLTGLLAGILLFGGALYYFHTGETEPVTLPGPVSAVRPASGQTTPPPVKAARDPVRSWGGFIKRGAADEVHHPKDIEEIKKQVYDLNIETVEDIPLLDRVVQTGGAPTRDFWLGDWVSVDDWKDETNGFLLQPQEDGTFISFPDEATTRTYTFFEIPRTYTYDPAKREFFWETDYYGKTISHRIRFINDNVLAMMLISGRKVVLDLYQRKPTESE